MTPERQDSRPATPASAPADSYAAHYQAAGAVSEAEQERLRRQGELFGRLASWTLDGLEVGPGRSVLELGCGGGALLLTAAERVGPTGRVVGVDRDPRLLAEARARAAACPWVEVVEADALAYDADGERFDAVHCRNVLLHQATPDDFVARMVALARPGGRVAAQEYDTEGPNGAPAFVCYPPFPALDRLAAAVHAALPHIGLDVQAGRKVADRFRRAGLRDLRAEGQLVTVFLTDPRIMTFLDLWWRLGPLCERTGVLPAAEFEALAAEVRTAHADPAYAGHLVRIPSIVATVGTQG